MKFVPNVVDAVTHLKKRYAEIAIRYPDFARLHPEAEYVSVNLRYALRNQDKRPHETGCAHWHCRPCNCSVERSAS